VYGGGIAFGLRAQQRARQKIAAAASATNISISRGKISAAGVARQRQRHAAISRRRGGRQQRHRRGIGAAKARKKRHRSGGSSIGGVIIGIRRRKSSSGMTGNQHQRQCQAKAKIKRRGVKKTVAA